MSLFPSTRQAELLSTTNHHVAAGAISSSIVPSRYPPFREVRAQFSRPALRRHSPLHELENDLIYRHNGSSKNSTSGEDGSLDWCADGRPTSSRLPGGDFPSHSWMVLKHHAVIYSHSESMLKGRVWFFHRENTAPWSSDLHVTYTRSNNIKKYCETTMKQYSLLLFRCTAGFSEGDLELRKSRQSDDTKTAPLR